MGRFGLHGGKSGGVGRDGAKGYKGPKGPTGNQGQIGNEGYSGPPGDNGIPGSAGIPGPPGPPGDMSGILTGKMWDRFNGGVKGPSWYRKRRSVDADDKSDDTESMINSNYHL